MVLDKILPTEWINAISNSKVNELRLRVGQPIRVLFNNKWTYLGKRGLQINQDGAYIASQSQLQDILYLACDKSVYAYNEQIVNGYLAVERGVRIGVCGTLVNSNGSVTAIKDVNSLVVRLPYHINNVCDKIMHYIQPPLSTLIISPPLAGKTTLVRDIARWLGEQGYNCLIADERFEIAPTGLIFAENTIKNCDVLSGFSKKYALNIGIRSLAPDCVICDELQNDEIEMIAHCVSYGVTAYATMHAGSVRDAIERVGRCLCFDRYVLLSRVNYIGEIIGVYDSIGNKIA